MELKDVQEQVELLLSLGHDKDEILRMAQTAPAILNVHPMSLKKFWIHLMNMELMLLKQDTLLKD